MPSAAPHHVDVHVLLHGKDGAVLLGQRRGKPVWEGHYQLPSGRLDPGEPLRAGAARELNEETGVTADPAALEMVHVTHHRSPYGTDRVGFFFAAHDWTGTVANAEPELCEGWEWWPPDSLPEPLPPYLAEALEHIARGRRYSEFGWGEETTT
ncbi:NUDIX domain-containing protein [Streptomyces sp. gCLA4]|uniref:NUDIX hydrolase n=1 Tax=Streptomyces sp. gCLA4 TaxID=1873416 RepID=UPI002180D08C|nr:NUDIX domain-containing protein [Streptomyces sp. gCLA4]